MNRLNYSFVLFVCLSLHLFMYFGEIALAGSRHLHSTLAAAPVLFAHAVVTEIKTSRISSPNLLAARMKSIWPSRYSTLSAPAA
jgi:hypothetical protein